MKTIETALKNGNNTVNQNIKQRFVGQHVFCNVNSLVEFCLKSEDGESPIQYDEIENIYTYPEYRGTFADFEGGTEEQRNEEIERLRDLQSDLYDEIQEDPDKEDELKAKREKIEDEIFELENLETEPQDIMEWWAVSEFLYRKLKEKGHPVVDAGSCYVWGRCTSGQSILLDYVITQICAEMGILEGQENSWA
jgi:hypothetical protein